MNRIVAGLMLAAGLGAAALVGVTSGLAAVGTQATASPRTQHSVLPKPQGNVLPLESSVGPQCNSGSSSYTLLNQIKTVMVQYFVYQPGTKRHFLVTPTRDSPASGCLQVNGGHWVIDARTPNGTYMTTTSLIPGHPAIRCLRGSHHNTKWFFVSAQG